MRNEINLTDEEIEQEFIDTFDAYPVVDELVFTRETIDNWYNSRENWNEKGQSPLEVKTKEGLAAVKFPRAQMRKGQERRDIVVIDFGDVRAVYK